MGNAIIINGKTFANRDEFIRFVENGDHSNADTIELFDMVSKLKESGEIPRPGPG